MRVMSKKEGGAFVKGGGDGRLMSREEGKGGWEACVKGRGDGRLVSREEGKGGWEAYVKGRSEERGVKGLALQFSSK